MKNQALQSFPYIQVKHMANKQFAPFMSVFTGTNWDIHFCAFYSGNCHPPPPPNPLLVYGMLGYVVYLTQKNTGGRGKGAFFLQPFRYCITYRASAPAQGIELKISSHKSGSFQAIYVSDCFPFSPRCYARAANCCSQIAQPYSRRASIPLFSLCPARVPNPEHAPN